MLSSTTLKIPVAAEPSLAGVPIIVSKSETLVFNVYNAELWLSTVAFKLVTVVSKVETLVYKLAT